MSRLRAAILVISETAFSDPSSDKTSDILREVFRNEGNDRWDVVEGKIVPDQVLEIQAALMRWTDGDAQINAIITSGGTGFATQDITPEAVSPLLHKHASGLVHGMLAASLSVTPCILYPLRDVQMKGELISKVALMSRPVAGVRHKTVILTLPGSPKGAKENLLSVLKLLPHACVQAAGADSRTLHSGGISKLEQEAGLKRGSNVDDTPSHNVKGSHVYNHNHEHSHRHSGHGHAHPVSHTALDANPKSNDYSLGPSRRHRSSPYPMLSVMDALQKISSEVPAALSVSMAMNHSTVGHVLAADVEATEAVPAFRASIVDGYAVCITKGAETNEKGVFPVAFSSHAHGGDVASLEPGQIARITTGAPLPPGSNAVVMVEDTVLKSKTEDGSEEKEVEILTDQVKTGENIREIGSDVQAGELVMKKGEGITAIGGEFGLLASVGTREVKVYRKPVVGVLSTGDEIVQHDREGELNLGEVRDTNRPTLLTAVRAQGYEVKDLGIASDKPQALEAILRHALGSVDVLLTTGGVSMGELDLLKPTLERALGGTIHFGRVSMKPGKPTTFATVPTMNIKDPASGKRGGQEWDLKPVFSLPGNPASAVVTFMLFVLPALHHMSGIRPAGLPRLPVRLESTVQCDSTREEYHRVILTTATVGGESGLWAMSTGGQRSSRIGSFKGANALVKLPAGGGTLSRGMTVEALLMGPIGGVQQI